MIIKFLNTFNVLICSIFLSTYLNAQQTKTDLEKEFEEFKKKENNNFNDYKEKVNQEISEFLKEEWKEYKKLSPLNAPFKPDPLVIPKEIPKPLPQPNIDKLPVVKSDLPKNTKKEEVKLEKDVEQKFDLQPDVPEKPTSNNHNKQDLEAGKKNNVESVFDQTKAINYYGCKINITYDKSMLIHCNAASEEGVSKYWADMAKQNYTAFVKQLERIIQKYSLNDWGEYQLVKKISENLNLDSNDQLSFQFFYLNQLGFNIKLAKSSNNLVLLLPVKEMIYGVPYLDIKGKRYFIMDNNGSSFFTFDKSIITSKKDISLQLNRKLNLDESISKKNFNLQNGKTICINYNLNNISFFNDYPQADLSILFNASASLAAEESILKELKPMLIGLNELDAVNLLLNFVQKKFEYKTDNEQFGKEKWFFPEDQLHYPYSDCEDRSVFFTYLVKKLLNLKVIGLNYPGHVAVAVAFNGSVNGYAINYKGYSYIIADPTYIGTTAGMCMPQFVNIKPKVVELLEY